MSEVFRHFDSLSEYTALRVSEVNLHTNYRPDDGGLNWFGVKDYATAEKICRAGVWPEGQARMERELAGFDAPPATSVRRRAVWADQGDTLDIHRVYGGQLDQAWRRTQRQSRPAVQEVVIAFPLMIASRHTAEKLFWCGAAALKLTDVLTQAGYSVGLIGTHGTTYGGHTGHDSLTVKAPSAPLDVEALVVAVAFTGFARTAGFTAIASNEFEVSGSLGTAIYDDPAPLQALGLPPQSVIRGLYAEVNDRETARAWISRQLAKLEQAAA